jgi:hypothetical protein
VFIGNSSQPITEPNYSCRSRAKVSRKGAKAQRQLDANYEGTKDAK